MAMYVILRRWDANTWPALHILWLPKETCLLLETRVTEILKWVMTEPFCSAKENHQPNYSILVS